MKVRKSAGERRCEMDGGWWGVSIQETTPPCKNVSNQFICKEQRVSMHVCASAQRGMGGDRIRDHHQVFRCVKCFY